jgi:hypothetical protein
VYFDICNTPQHSENPAMSTTTSTPKAGTPLARLYQLAKEQFKVESPVQVAGVIGETPQTLNNWAKRGTVSRPGAMKLQERYGWSALWIREGKGPKHIERESSDVDHRPIDVPPTHMRNVKVEGFLLIKEGGVVEMKVGLPGEEMQVFAFTGGRSAQAWRVHSHSLHPRYRYGEYVLVRADKRESPVRGEDVFVSYWENKKRVTVLAELYEAGPNEITVIDVLNSNKRTTYPSKGCEIIRVIGTASASSELH